jgi:DNA-binding GntR family transcriptional regulator
MPYPSPLEALEKENLGDMAYAQICDGLIRGRFEPGARLTIRDLATSLGTSVTPVRDAILRLIKDEALVQKSAREVRVPILTEERYREIRKIRLRLEGLAAHEAALRAGPADIEFLRSLIARNEAAIAAKDWLAALDLNQTFHFSLGDIAGMHLLRGILNRLWLQMGPVIAEFYPTGGELRTGNHHRVVQAIADRDPAAAEAAICRDISEAGEIIITTLARRRASDGTGTA